MLRRAENVSVSHERAWPRRRGPVVVRVAGATHRLPALHRERFAELAVIQRTEPVQLLRVGERTYWQFRDRFYWDNDALRNDEVYAVILTREQRDTARVTRAQSIVAQDGHAVTAGTQQRRGGIPDDVKQLVLTRDGHRCVHCGSRSELQFDHVIPYANGGSSDPENLQILCGRCNRRKGARVTVI